MAANDFQNNNRPPINNYHGKSFSILGDSISTLEGFTPRNYNVFYKGSVKEQYNVKTPQDTWWGKVVNYFGGKLLVNNSWSGCRVTKIPENQSLFPSACSNERTGTLHLMNDTPDVIIVFVGINDWASGVPLDSNNPNETVFTFAYNSMLQKIRKNYPSSEIRCCTLPKTFVRRNRNFRFPETVNGHSIDEFNNVIMRLAQSNGCKVIALHSHNTPYSALDGTHPDDDGMRTIADLMIRELGAQKVAQNFEMRSDEVKRSRFSNFGSVFGKGNTPPQNPVSSSPSPSPMNMRPSTPPTPNKVYKGANSFTPDNNSPVIRSGMNQNNYAQNRPQQQNGMNPIRFAPIGSNPYMQNNANAGRYPQNQAARNGYAQNGMNQNRPAQNQFAQNGMNQNRSAQNQYAQNGMNQNRFAQNQYAQNGINQNGSAPNQFARNGINPNKFAPSTTNPYMQNNSNRENYNINQPSRNRSNGEKFIASQPSQNSSALQNTNSPMTNMDLFKDFDEYSGKNLGDYSGFSAPSPAPNNFSSAQTVLAHEEPAAADLNASEEKVEQTPAVKKPQPSFEFIDLSPEKTFQKDYTNHVCLYYESCDEYVPVNSDLVKMGRGRDSDVLIKSSYVARHQANLRFEAGFWFIQDNNSTNGSKLNGTKLDPGAFYILHEGDIMEFADSAKFVFDVTE